MSHSMSLSQETSSGCFTSEEEEQRRILVQTPTSHVTQLLVCLECGCKLEAISQQIMDLQDDNRCLRCQLIKESESARRERYHRMDLQQMMVKTKRKHEEEMDRLQKKLATSHSKNEDLQEYVRQEQYHRKEVQQMLEKTNAELAACRSENHSLKHQLQVSQMDCECESLRKKLLHKQRKWEGLVHTGGLLQKNITRLEQQLSDSERKRERAEQTMLTYKSLVSDITDEAEQLDGEVRQLDGEVRQLQRSYKELRETTFRAFCKVRPSLLDLQVVILQHIPNSREYSDVWLEFLTALNMNHKDIPALVLSECDARWNVQNVLDAWLRGSGSEPKTWGTFLKGMHERGTPFLRELADAAENVYWRKLTSLHLPFDVCCVCWKSCLPTFATECSES